MQRRLSVVPGVGLNALAGDRHYDGLRSTEGIDISTRSKHREYMRQTGLTMASDFKGTWEKATVDRETQRLGQHADKELRSLVTEQVMRAVAQPD